MIRRVGGEFLEALMWLSLLWWIVGCRLLALYDGEGASSASVDSFNLSSEILKALAKVHVLRGISIDDAFLLPSLSVLGYL